jgi:hypothetical protein
MQQATEKIFSPFEKRGELWQQRECFHTVENFTEFIQVDILKCGF